MRRKSTFRAPLRSRSPQDTIWVQHQLSAAATAFRQAMVTGRYQEAREHCERVLSLTPHNPSVMGDYALTLMRCGDYQKSWEIYTRMFQEKERQQYAGNWLDGLTEVCGWLGKEKELRYYGHYALTQADLACCDGTCYPLPSSAPPAFDPDALNIIAFSLYGENPRYCETIVKNAQICPELYPGWRMRVYHNSSVPEHVLTRLSALHVELVNMSAHTDIFPTLWRFLVLDDRRVARYLIRDADALFSEKETAAVQMWLQSDAWYHHMRDYFTHTELLLAGMWGGCSTSALPSIGDLICGFLSTYQGNQRYTDQQFLRHVLWPTIRTSLLSHDEIFLFGNARPYPTHPPVRWKGERFHIGCNAAWSGIEGRVKNTDAEHVIIRFSSSHLNVDYRADVQEGRWAIAVPFFMMEEYQTGRLHITADIG